MDVFALRERLVADYASYVRSFINIRDDRIAEAAEYLGVSGHMLRSWDAAGKLEVRRHPVSNFRLYLRGELDAAPAALSDDRGIRACGGPPRNTACSMPWSCPAKLRAGHLAITSAVG